MFSGVIPELAAECASARGNGSLPAWPTLLVVDPDEADTRTLVCFFEKRGFHVAAGASFADVREYFHRCKHWTLIISEFHLPDGTGAEVCEWLHDQGCNAPVLLMSASPNAAGFCTGYWFLSKPLDLAVLEDCVRNRQKHLPVPRH